MKRIKNLDNYQKGILVVMLAMALIFAVIYSFTISKVGYRYNDTILVPTQENGNTVYTGKIKGEQAQFIVSNDNTVVFNYGEKSYGPFTIKEDPTAIPDGAGDLMEKMIGIEIHNGDTLLFRGAVLDSVDFFNLYYDDGRVWSENHNVIDSIEPSAFHIYELLHHPPLTHKGNPFIWFAAVCISIINALSILFIDELFRFHLSFQIHNVDSAEPSDWELSRRYIGWTVTTIMILAIYILGLYI